MAVVETAAGLLAGLLLLLASCSAIINNISQFCRQETAHLQGVVSKTFHIEMKAKLC